MIFYWESSNNTILHFGNEFSDKLSEKEARKWSEYFWTEKGMGVGGWEAPGEI